MSKRVLVTGGAGYIGSHTVRALKSAGFDVVIIDNLSSGHRRAVSDFELVEGDLSDRDFLKKVFDNYSPEFVIHFAGSIEAGESMTDPGRFYRNNTLNGLNLLDAMREAGVKKIVFSSTAAVYGEPEKVPIEEDDLKEPTNIYGESKLMFESILKAYDNAYGIKHINLRYFNAAGADHSGAIGADHKNKTHLITLICMTALGQRESIKIFGTDYDTPDGTCIRDYIHVSDLADAHVLAINYLDKNGISDSFNLGNERGVSVKEVIGCAKKIIKIDFVVAVEAKRIGDPAVLVASSARARKILGWRPKYGKIEDIIETAWRWHSRNQNGFED